MTNKLPLNILWNVENIYFAIYVNTATSSIIILPMQAFSADSLLRHADIKL